MKAYSTSGNSSYVNYTTESFTSAINTTKILYVCTACKPGYTPIVIVNSTVIPLYFYLNTSIPNDVTNYEDLLVKTELLGNQASTFYYPKKLIH